MAVLQQLKFYLTTHLAHELEILKLFLHFPDFYQQLQLLLKINAPAALHFDLLVVELVSEFLVMHDHLTQHREHGLQPICEVELKRSAHFLGLARSRP